MTTATYKSELRDTVHSFEELRHEFAAYEDLRSGGVAPIRLESFEQFPHALVQARIAAGFSQKDLAERLGLKEQQIQRYEATAYASASLTRIKEVLAALGVQQFPEGSKAQ